MNSNKAKLSKSILDMKFMKRTKEKVEKQQFQEEGEEYFGNELTKRMKQESNKQDKNVDIPSPPGYTPAVALFHAADSIRETDSNHLIMKKSWDLALGPLKQIPMNLFIMYMAGNSIAIFPIMMVGMLIIRPVKALFTLQQTFKVIEGTHAVGQKCVYFLGQLINIALALYKCQSMGLLPTHASDWLAFVEPQARLEYSGGGFIYV